MKKNRNLLKLLLLVVLGSLLLFSCENNNKKPKLNQKTPSSQVSEVFKLTIKDNPEYVLFDNDYKNNKEIAKDSEVGFKINKEKLIKDKKVILEVRLNEKPLLADNGIYKVKLDENKTISFLTTKMTEGLTYNLDINSDSYVVSGNAQTKDIEKIVIPYYHEGKNISKIGDFSDYKNLKEVIFPDTISKVMDNAFKDSINLESFNSYNCNDKGHFLFVEDGVIFSKDKKELILFPVAKTNDEKIYRIPQSVVKISKYAFAGIKTGDKYDPEYHDKLETIILPNYLKEINKGAFLNRNNLKTVKFYSDDIKKEGLANEEYKVLDNAFEGSGIITFPFQDKLIYIGDNAFKGSLKLETVKLSDNLTYLGVNSFMNTNIKNIELNGTFNEISKGSFEGSRLEKVIFNNLPNLKKIGDRTFRYIRTLKEIVIPENIEEIGVEAFGECEELRTISLPKSLKKMDVNAFCSTDELKVEKINLNGNDNFVVEDGILYDKIKTKIYKYSSIKEYNMPDSVNEISKGLFNGDNETQKIVLSKSLTFIPEETFMSAQALEYVFIPNSIINIAGDNFKYFAKQITIEFEKDSKLTTLGEDAFGWASSGMTLKINDVSVVNAFISNEDSGLDSVNIFLINDVIEEKDLAKEFLKLFKYKETKDNYKVYIQE